MHFMWQTGWKILSKLTGLSGDWSVTNSVEQSYSWEASSRPASQDIPYLLRNPKVHCRIRKRPPLRASWIHSRCSRVPPFEVVVGQYSLSAPRWWGCGPWWVHEAGLDPACELVAEGPRAVPGTVLLTLQPCRALTANWQVQRSWDVTRCLGLSCQVQGERGC